MENQWQKRIKKILLSVIVIPVSFMGVFQPKSLLMANILQNTLEGLKQGKIAESGAIRGEQDIFKNLELTPKLEYLIKCESGGNIYALNPDDGGSPSYGLVQWKEQSFWYYNEKYKILQDLEREEVLNIIYEPYAQIELAKKVLEEENGWKNWFNCLKNYDNQP